MQCNFLSDYLDFFALYTKLNAASWKLEQFGEAGRDVPEYFSSGEDFGKMIGKKLSQKISSKNTKAVMRNLKFCFMYISVMVSCILLF